jgi:hypothetical protein
LQYKKNHHGGAELHFEIEDATKTDFIGITQSNNIKSWIYPVDEVLFTNEKNATLKRL